MIGYAKAEDSLFTEMKNFAAIGEEFRTPFEWFSQAKTVISIFLPFTSDVRESNYITNDVPSNAWLFGRVEGQDFVNEIAKFTVSLLEKEGYKAIIPTLDARFKVGNEIRKNTHNIEGKFAQEKEILHFTSSWSERHVAYICGLGTFGLSGGLITHKGMCGRFTSIITDAEIEATKREYNELYEYCIMCGKCAKRCPVEAISMSEGKNHAACGPFVSKTKEIYAPRYGCGKCQTNVPCENKIP